MLLRQAPAGAEPVGGQIRSRSRPCMRVEGVVGGSRVPAEFTATVSCMIACVSFGRCRFSGLVAGRRSPSRVWLGIAGRVWVARDGHHVRDGADHGVDLLFAHAPADGVGLGSGPGSRARVGGSGPGRPATGMGRWPLAGPRPPAGPAAARRCLGVRHIRGAAASWRGVAAVGGEQERSGAATRPKAKVSTLGGGQT